MARSQAIQATNHEDTTNTRDSDSIRHLESSDDDIFDDEVAAEDEDVPDDDAASWTTYYSGGDDASPPPVPHDINLPSVSVRHDVNLSVQQDNNLFVVPSGCSSRSGSRRSVSSSVPQVISVSSEGDDGSSAAINSIMSASTSYTRQSTMSASTIHLINRDLRKSLVRKFLKRFETYTEMSRSSRNGMLLEDALNAAYRLAFEHDNDNYTEMVMQ